MGKYFFIGSFSQKVLGKDQLGDVTISYTVHILTRSYGNKNLFKIIFIFEKLSRLKQSIVIHYNQWSIKCHNYAYA